MIVNNCSFRELSGADPDLVCAMHRAFLEGVLEVVTAGLGRLRDRPGRLPHQLRRRALRAALLVLVRRRVREPRRPAILYGRRSTHREEPLTIDEAIRDLLDVSTDIRSVAVVDEAGDVVAAGPGAAGRRCRARRSPRLWDAAAVAPARLATPALDHVVVPVSGGAVAVVAAHGRRIAAVTGPEPAVGLLLFDLRTCLGDAFAAEGGAQ